MDSGSAPQTITRFRPNRKTALIATTCIFLAVSLYTGLTKGYFFLAINTGQPTADILIIEGWVPDYAIEESLLIATNKGHKLILTTGGEIAIGSHLSSYKTYAELARASLVKLGFDPTAIIAINSNDSPRNRTYQTAMSFKMWLEDNPKITSACLVSLGPHTRRSYNTYKSVLPDNFKLGCIAITPRDYDSNQWWKTSAGFRSVSGEALAYVYSLLTL